MKNKAKYQTVRTLQNFVETETYSIPITDIHDGSLSWLGTESQIYMTAHFPDWYGITDIYDGSLSRLGTESQIYMMAHFPCLVRTLQYKRRYQIWCTLRVSGITFTTYPQGQTIL